MESLRDSVPFCQIRITALTFQGDCKNRKKKYLEEDLVRREWPEHGHHHHFARGVLSSLQP
jgi:hypothetical protein